jgi:hypothetical protein
MTTARGELSPRLFKICFRTGANGADCKVLERARSLENGEAQSNHANTEQNRVDDLAHSKSVGGSPNHERPGDECEGLRFEHRFRQRAGVRGQVRQ